MASNVLIGGLPVELRAPAGGLAWLRRVGVTLAFIAIVTGGLTIALGGINLTFDRVFGLLLLPLLATHLLGNFGPRGPRRLLWLWSGWLAALGVSMLATGDPGGHLIPFVSALIPVAYFSLITIGPLDGAFVHRLVRILLWGHIVMGVASLLLLRVLGLDSLAAPFVDQLGRLRLLMFEPNLLGATLAFLIMVSLPRARWTATNIVFYALAAVVLVATFSKMPLIATVIGAALYGVLRAIALGRGGTTAVVLPLWLGGAALTAAIAVLPLVQRVYVNVLDRSDAVASRLYLFRLAWQRFLESPIIGRGPGDFGLQDLNVLKAVGAADRENLWIGQMALAILHDSGIVGLGIYLAFLVFLFARAAKWIRAGSLDHAGYVAGFATILISSQATTAHLAPVFGIAAGLVGSSPFVLTHLQRRQFVAEVRG